MNNIMTVLLFLMLVLQDRFAIDRYLPPVDESQDWFLVSGEEENGYTILEFTRNLTTCDDHDLNIKVDWFCFLRLTVDGDCESSLQ